MNPPPPLPLSPNYLSFILYDFPFLNVRLSSPLQNRVDVSKARGNNNST